MNRIYEWLVENRDWVFQGIGVFLISLIVAFIRKKRHSDRGDTIVTTGPFSPGKVEGDYEVEFNERQ